MEIDGNILSDMGKGIYQRTKPTGFLHPQIERRVHVGRVGVVYLGRNARDAERARLRWEKLASEPLGRASGQKVTITIL